MLCHHYKIYNWESIFCESTSQVISKHKNADITNMIVATVRQVKQIMVVFEYHKILADYIFL